VDNVTVTRNDIVAGLRGLGIGEGDRILVHSSLRSFGYVEGGPEAVVDALLETVGPQGTVVVPTFTYGVIFDVAEDPPRTGRIPQVFWRRPEAIRSPHVSHSVAAIGPLAQELYQADIGVYGLGLGSAVDRLAKAGGWVVLLGVNHTVNSTVHTGEFYAHAPYLREVLPPQQIRGYSFLPGGRRIEYDCTYQPGCSEGFWQVEQPLRAKGAIADGVIGLSRVQVMKGQAVIDTVVEMLRNDMTALLCQPGACEHCDLSRKMIAAANSQA